MNQAILDEKGLIPVGKSTDVPERSQLVIDVGERTIGIFRIDGKLYAHHNECPPQCGSVQ